ncbi:MAG: aspartate carbamoyltransferase [Oscillospiraceae bacterium]|nr:aspartate carbamoyltransferase [Oscillospiraceae bacterium]
MGHLIDFNDLTFAEWKKIISQAADIEKYTSRFSGALNGKILGTLFYEPSTRTQMSFKTAMYRLGGQIIGFSDSASTSGVKGESLTDTIRMVCSYADVIAIRHPKPGSAKAAAMAADCPVINAGDGGHLHPTQTLTDLVTLNKKLGEVKNITVGFCGDLKYGRTVHSLVKTLLYFDGIKFVFISTENLRIPEYLRGMLDAHNAVYRDVFSLDDAISSLDVLYMTRIQKERFSSHEDYIDQSGKYILNNKKLINAKKDMLIMHPLPRVDEIHPEVDSDGRAIYFEQAKCGVFARMSLILHLLSAVKPVPHCPENPADNLKCANQDCITNHEDNIPVSFRRFNDKSYCEYCEEEDF